MITQEMIQDKLKDLAGLRFKKRFFGISIYCQSVFFGMLIKDKLYFRVNSETLTDYEAYQMKAYQFKLAAQDLFYEVPGKIFKDSNRLLEWANKAINIQA